MKWDDELPGCFGGMAPPFGGSFAHHPRDEERALAWIASLRSRRLDTNNALSQIEAYLRAEKVPEIRIQEEIARAQSFLRTHLGE